MADCNKRATAAQLTGFTFERPPLLSFSHTHVDIQEKGHPTWDSDPVNQHFSLNNQALITLVNTRRIIIRKTGDVLNI